MAIANEANSGGRHPAVLTSDANAADRPLCVVDVSAGAGSGGAHSESGPLSKRARSGISFTTVPKPLFERQQEICDKNAKGQKSEIGQI